MLHQATICEVCRSSIFIGFLRVGPVVCLTLSPPPLLFTPRSMPSPSVRLSRAGKKDTTTTRKQAAAAKQLDTHDCEMRSPAARRRSWRRNSTNSTAVISRSISLSSPPKGALNQQGIGHRRGDSRAESRTACRPLPSSTKPVCWCPLCRLR